MSERYVVVVSLHVLAAMVWLGGMVFFALAAPELRRVGDDEVRARLFDGLGRRFRLVGWVCVGILVLTGVEQLRLRGWWGAAFWRAVLLDRGAFGTVLSTKLGLVVVMLVVQGVHDFWLGPRAGRADPGTPNAIALRKRAAWLARANALLGLALVYAAVRLARS